MGGTVLEDGSDVGMMCSLVEMRGSATLSVTSLKPGKGPQVGPTGRTLVPGIATSMILGIFGSPALIQIKLVAGETGGEADQDRREGHLGNPEF
jgi:hypothetical protein